MAEQITDLEWEEWDGKGSFLSHCIAGSTAGVVEHTIMYPIDTLRTHMQCSHCGKAGNYRSFMSSFRSVLQEGGGPMRLWRGVGTMLTACIPAHAMYFSIYETIKQRNEKRKLGWVGDAMSGAAATIAHDSIMTPSDLVKQRLQLGYYRGIFDCISTVIRTEGVRALYVSFMTTLTMNVPYGCVMVATNETLKRILNPSGEYNITSIVAASSIAGSVAAAVTTPLDVIKSRLQTQGLQNIPPPHVPARSAAAAGAGGTASSHIGNLGWWSKYRPAATRQSFPLGPAASMVGDMRGISTAGARAAQILPSSSSSSSTATSGATAAHCSRRAGVVPREHTRRFCKGDIPLCKRRQANQFMAGQPASVLRGTGGSIGSSIGSSSMSGGGSGGHGAGGGGGAPGASSIRYSGGVRGIMDCAKHIYATEGVRGFSRGLAPRMVTHAPSVAISWTVYESVKACLE